MPVFAQGRVEHQNEPKGPPLWGRLGSFWCSIRLLISVKKCSIWWRKPCTVRTLKYRRQKVFRPSLFFRIFETVFCRVWDSIFSTPAFWHKYEIFFKYPSIWYFCYILLLIARIRKFDAFLFTIYRLLVFPSSFTSNITNYTLTIGMYFAFSPTLSLPNSFMCKFILRYYLEIMSQFPLRIRKISY